MRGGIKARPIGRILRFLAGIALAAEASRHMIDASATFNLSVAAVIAGLLTFYAVAHLAVVKFVPTINRWLGAAVALTPVIAVFLLGGGPGQLGVLLFIGVSLLFTAVRADGGCEVMTLPGMFLGSRTHLVCIVFSPVDWVEAKLSRSEDPNQAAPNPWEFWTMIRFPKRKAILSAVLVPAAIVVAVLLINDESVQQQYDGPKKDTRAHDLAGWYEIDADKRFLVTPSAFGGLYVADFKNYASSRIKISDTNNHVWTGSGGAFTRSVEFSMTGAFTWSEEGVTNQASRIEGPYTQEEVFFLNDTIELSGLLFCPRGKEPVAAAVIIHGSGASNRDNLWYQLIVDHLVREGFAILLPDKRGTGKSEGNWKKARFEEFAADAIAGLHFMSGDERIDSSRIGLLGMSQGGWIAPLSASLSEDVAFIVSVAGTTVRPKEQLLHESKQTLRQQGVPRTIATPLGYLTAVVPKIRRFSWWRKNGGFDPIPYWESLNVSGLVLYGNEDEGDNVPVNESVSRLEAIVDGESHITVKVFEGTGHGFMDATTERIREDFLTFLSEWMTDNSS